MNVQTPSATEPLDLCERAPSYIRAISAYQPGKPITELARDLGLDERTIVKLASNENPLGLSPKARAAIQGAIPELARYPDQFDLVAAVALVHERKGAVFARGPRQLENRLGKSALAPNSIEKRRHPRTPGARRSP